jgi:hypothetical protein
MVTSLTFLRISLRRAASGGKTSRNLLLATFDGSGGRRDRRSADRASR